MIKKQMIRASCALLLLCVLLLQTCPVSASDSVRLYTTEMQTAELSAYAFQPQAVDFSTSYLFYDQLTTDDQKALYERLVCATPADAVITLSVQTLPALPAPDHPDFESALIAYLSDLVLPAYAAAVQDTPMLFWTSSVGYSCSYTLLGDELVSIEAICSPILGNGFSESDYNAAYQEILGVLQGITFDGKTCEELLLQFHDHLCNTIVYIDSAHAHNIYGALVEGEAVCEGYAKTFKLFCDLYDIPCMLITGKAVTSTGYDPHAWNAVRMEDGNWYAIDVTWDDQTKTYYDFFLIGSQTVPEAFEDLTFAESHHENGDFYGNGSVIMQFPTLAENAYTHTHVYDSGTITLQPTCLDTGTITYACLSCSAFYSEALPTVDHDYQDGACSVCGLAAPDTVYGDCNGDDVINGMDVTRLLRYMATFNPITDTSSIEISAGADCNGDGVLNGMDVTRLLRYLASYNPITGESTVTLGK